MLDSLDALVEQYPLSRYIVSSRPTAINARDWPRWSEWTSKRGFVELEIQPLDAEQIERFVEKWHGALAAAISDDEERATVISLERGLLRLLRSKPSLRRLAASPLLCAMICALHRDRLENLHPERARLYRDCCEMLLQGRDLTRKVLPNPDYPTFSTEQLFVLVRSLAYWMKRNDWAEVDTSDVDSFLDQELPRLARPSPCTGADVRRLLVERSSILREPVMGQSDFTHRTFQDFLAADEIVKNGEYGMLLGKMLDDRWSETIVLAAGLADRKTQRKLVEGALKKAGSLRRERNRQRIVMLTVACLETCIDLDPALRNEILSAASTVFPPVDLSDAAIVAAAGDPAVPFLEYRQTLTSEQAVACVSALAQIGSEPALTALVGFVGSAKQSVRFALGQAWDSFDREEFAERVLSRDSSLFVPSLGVLEGFEKLAHVKHLYIRSVLDSRVLERAVSAMRLESLWLFDYVSGGEMPIFAATPALKGIRKLFVSAPVLDLGCLDFVRDLQELRDLTIVGSRVESLEALSGLSNLEAVSIPACRPVRDLSPLAELQRLKVLDIRFTQISSLLPVEKLPELRRLLLMGSGVVELGALGRRAEVVVDGPEVSKGPVG